MTARTTSPFLTGAFGIAVLTLAMIAAPIPATVVRERPMIRMHSIVRAPVLSATRSRVEAWITHDLLRRPARQRPPRDRHRGPRPDPRGAGGAVAARAGVGAAVLVTILAARVGRGVDRLGGRGLLGRDLLAGPLL